MKAILVFVITLFAVKSLAQEAGVANEVKVSSKLFDEIQGAPWKGIVFYCNPYCEFLSVKEVEVWRPEPQDKLIFKDKLKWIRQTDPVYPLLVAKLPIMPFVTQNSNSKESEDPNRKKKEKGIPNFAKSKFDFLWSVMLGPDLKSLSLKSDSQIQSTLGPKSPFLNFGIHLQLAKGKPFYFYGNYIQTLFQYSKVSSLTYPTQDEDLKISYGLDTMDLTFWSMKKNSKWGLGLVQKTKKFQPQFSSLPHYQMSQTDTLLKFGLIQWKRWKFEFDYLLNSQVNDSQNFRAQPFTVSGYELHGNYCAKELNLFDIHFGYCAGFYWAQQNQSSGVNQDFLSDQSVNIKSSEAGSFILLRFGGDFFQ